MPTAKAHTREQYTYSNFHRTLLNANPDENYALKHLYSLENTKHLLQKWEWSAEDIKKIIDSIVIDVFQYQVLISAKGLCRFVSKADYIKALVQRCWAKADPYKLEPGDSWQEFIACGNTGDFYNVELYQEEITCTCHAYSGIRKAFSQDPIANFVLQKNEMVKGQVPDKHVFAVWKYLGAENFNQYQYCWHERQMRAIK